MQRANEPSEAYLVVQDLQDCSRLLRRRVHKSEREVSLSQAGARRRSLRRCRTHRTSLRYPAGSGAASSRGSGPRVEAADRASCQFRGSGAWRPLRIDRRRRAGRKQFARLDVQVPIEDLERVFEQAALRRPGCARAVPVICSAVARAHEKARLRKPPHRAAQVRAINREYLEPAVSTWRTQQGMSAVSPSEACATGLRYVARRVSPDGN